MSCGSCPEGTEKQHGRVEARRQKELWRNETLCDLGNLTGKHNCYCFLLVSLTRLLVKLPSQNFSLTFQLGDAASKNTDLQGSVAKSL